ncbi:prepilin peptidase [Patescibacteria group bacterium]|nr:prepilin peptidase [Patescibacteria group bacterium]
MNYLFYVFIFILGSAIGSFLNVIILRLRSGQVCRLATGEDIVKKRSHCPKCGQVLRWSDLIPVVSFFILRGRCRDCKGKISWQYPAVEAATGLLFLAIFIFLFPELVEGFKILAFDFASLRSGDIIGVFYFLYLISSLVVIFVYDLRHYIIPDKVLFPAIGVALGYRIFDAFAINPFRPLLNLRGGEGELLINALTIIYPYLLSALVASAFFLLLILITRGRGMGLGDAKLAFLMGLILGWPNILFALFLAFFGGALFGVSLIILGRKTLKSQIPFGPFLIGGTIILLLFGQFFWEWQERIFF